MPTWLQTIDDSVRQWFVERQTGFLRYNFEQITALGGTTLLALFVLFAAGMLLLYRQPARAGLLVVLALALCGATEGIKAWVNRPRPPKIVEAGQKPPKAPAKPKEGGETSSPSFPSSHASRSMGVFLMLALCLRRQPRAFSYAFVWALVGSLIVGVSRLYLGKHYLSDVTAGWLLGLVFALLFYLGDRKFSREPLASA